jgi:nucleotide-binding universal stress UspA family protein
MTKVLAAIDDSASARPVIATARSLAAALRATPEALHVRENHPEGPRDAAEAAGVLYREITGDVVDEVANAADVDDVAVVVVGVRSSPTGARPAGHVALELMTRLTKPLVVVPPGARPPLVLRRVAVPLDGTPETAARARPALDLATLAGIDVIVIHVCDEDRIPPFSDQPQHETRAFAEEFVARYVPGAPMQLELRVGVPADEVLGAAVALDADLCALAWAQALGHGRARVVKELLAHSPIPLLLLPMSTAASTTSSERTSDL